VHGLNGAVRVEILTDQPEERYAPGSVLHLEGSVEPLTIVWSSPVADGPGWRLRFREVQDRGAAEPLQGAYLEADLESDEVLPRGSYYWHEVIGATVRAPDDTVLGTVADVYRSGGAEVFIVRGEPYGEFDLPAVRTFIRVFAPRRGEIVADPVALDLQPPRDRRDGDRPKAPRRRPGPRRPRTMPPSDSTPGSAPSSTEESEA
jgi:16S rRNA processing protein RimM